MSVTSQLVLCTPEPSSRPFTRIGCRTSQSALVNTKTEGQSTTAGTNLPWSARELAALRKMILEEQLDEFRTQKPKLQRDLTETILGRLTRPSERLASQLTDDPQVKEARAIAADRVRYSRFLDPTPEGLTTLNAKNKASENENVLLFPLEGRLP